MCGLEKRDARKIRGIIQRLHQEFIFGIQTSNEHPVNDHVTEKTSLCCGLWTIGEAERERDLESKRQEGGERQGEACTVTGMHSDRHAR